MKNQSEIPTRKTTWQTMNRTKCHKKIWSKDLVSLRMVFCMEYYLFLFALLLPHRRAIFSDIILSVASILEKHSNRNAILLLLTSTTLISQVVLEPNNILFRTESKSPPCNLERICLLMRPDSSLEVDV